MKRILSLAIALVMLLSLAVSAGAEYDEHMTISWTSVMEGDEGNDYTHLQNNRRKIQRRL